MSNVVCILFLLPDARCCAYCICVLQFCNASMASRHIAFKNSGRCVGKTLLVHLLARLCCCDVFIARICASPAAVPGR